MNHANLVLVARPAVEDDIPLVCTMPQNPEELFFLAPRASFPLTPAQLHLTLLERQHNTVVTLNDTVAGFANFYHVQAGEFASVGNVIVAPWARGLGVGRHLMDAMGGLASRHHGARELHISCFNRNTDGLLFYHRLGFVPYGLEERRDRAGRRVGLIQLRRPIPIAGTPS